MDPSVWIDLVLIPDGLKLNCILEILTFAHRALVISVIHTEDHQPFGRPLQAVCSCWKCVVKWVQQGFQGMSLHTPWGLMYWNFQSTRPWLCYFVFLTEGWKSWRCHMCGGQKLQIGDGLIRRILECLGVRRWWRRSQRLLGSTPPVSGGILKRSRKGIW